MSILLQNSPKAFGVWSTVRGEDDVTAFGLENGIKHLRELGVMIVDQEAKVSIPIIEIPNQMSGLLSYPDRVLERAGYYSDGEYCV